MFVSLSNRLMRKIALLLMILGLLLCVFSFHKKVTIQFNDEKYQINTFSYSVASIINREKISLTTTDLVNPPVQSKIWTDSTITIRSIMPITIINGDSRTGALTYKRIVGNILSDQGIKLYPGDKLFLDGNEIQADKKLAYKSTPQEITIKPSTKIIVHDQNSTKSFTTIETNLKAALAEQGYQFHPEDFVEPPLNTKIVGGILNVYISRAKTVNISYKNQKYPTKIVAQTVGDAIAKAGFALQGQDFCTPSEFSPLTDNDTIEIHKIDEKIILEQETAPFGVQYQPMNDTEIDNLVVLQAGTYGLKVKRIKEIYLDGELTDREQEYDWTVKEPEPRVIGYGTKITIKTLNTPDGPIKYWRAIKAYASSYSPCRSGVPNKCYPNTSSGKPVQKGVIAVTLSWYRYMKGMAVYIPGYGFATIEDVGAGLPNQNWVDLGYSDEDWVGWGQFVTIYFLAPPPSPEYIMWILD